MEVKTGILQRLKVVYFMILFIAVCILLLLVQIQFSPKWSEKSKLFEVVQVPVQARRGTIFAADGSPLAASIPHYSLRMDLGVPQLKKYFAHDVDSLALMLSRFFREKSASGYRRALTDAYQRGDHYFLISSHKVGYDELQKIKRFPIFRNGQFKGGLIVEQDYERIYPLGNLESRTLGKMKEGVWDGMPAQVGAFGLEESFERDLRGEDGLAEKENISGRTMEVHLDEPTDGCDLVTTLDVKLQDQVSYSLRKMLEKTRAKYGTAILMEVKTGDIKAISNYGRNSGGTLVQGYQNYALGSAGCSEPGSTFKLASLMAAMEDGKIDTSTIVDTGNGVWTTKKWKVTDSDHDKKGGFHQINAKRVFEVSSNVGVAKLITQNYAGDERAFFSRIHDFGLDIPLKVGISGEGEPYINRPGDKTWSGVSLIQISYGYELKLTPLQVLTFYNAVANDGRMMQPRLVSAVSDNGEITRSFGTKTIKYSICSNSTLRKAHAMLEGVIENGTGKALRSSNYKIAGKTGTAQVANKNEGYSKNGRKVYQASFAGYFPADEPKYSCIVVINHPLGDYYGATVAGPVFRQIADYVYAYELGLKDELKNSGIKVEEDYPGFVAGRKKDIARVLKDLDIMNGWSFYKSEWVEANREDDGVALTSRELKPGTIPNVKGMGVTDAVYLLEKSGLRVSLRGFGKVKSQSLRAGDPMRRGQNIVITLG
ncbi:MAG: penicillin-binding protein [Prolixibacteraceae bacterium]